MVTASESNTFSHSLNNKSYDRLRYSGLYSVDKLIGNLLVQDTGMKLLEYPGMTDRTTAFGFTSFNLL